MHFQTELLRSYLVSRRQFLRVGLDSVVDGRVIPEQLQGLNARRGGNRIAGQSACLIYFAGRRHFLHNLFLTAVHCHRHAAADDLAQCCHIRLHAEPLLCAADAQTESCDNLVEDQDCSVLLGDLPKELQESFLRQNHTHVGGHRLHDESGNLIFIILKQLPDRISVIIESHQSLLCKGRRNAGAVRHGLGERSRACLH